MSLQRQGHGVISNTSGYTYKGNWVDDLISGHGQFLFPLTEDDDGDETKRKSIYRLWEPPMEFRDLIKMIKTEQREK